MIDFGLFCSWRFVLLWKGEWCEADKSERRAALGVWGGWGVHLWAGRAWQAKPGWLGLSSCCGRLWRESEVEWLEQRCERVRGEGKI